MLIGISGKMGVGKTTCADVARMEFSAHKTAFAKPLKIELVRALAQMGVIFSTHCIYGVKADKDKLFSVQNHRVPMEYLDYGFANAAVADKGYYTMSFRAFLQWYGTEYRRAQNPDYWLERFLADYDDDVFTIVDDIRMPNEAECIKTCGGFLIRINRKDYGYSNTHPSETSLDDYAGFNLVITNDVSLEQFLVLCREAVIYAKIYLSVV